MNTGASYSIRAVRSRIYSQDGRIMAEDIHSEGIRALASSGDDLPLIHLGLQRGALDIRDAESLARLASLPADAGECTHLTSHPFLPITGTSGSENVVRLWDVKRKCMIYEKPHGGPVVGLAFSEDGRFSYRRVRLCAAVLCI